jgi:hypothetical protein
MDVGVVLKLPTPGMEEAGKTRQVRAEKALLLSEPCESRGRSLEQSGVGEALRRADAGAEGLRDGESAEDVRSGELCCKWGMSPLRCCVMLPLRAGPIAAGMVDAVLPATALARRETGSGMSAAAGLDGAEGLVVGRGQRGITLKILWHNGVENIADGSQKVSPRITALMRS